MIARGVPRRRAFRVLQIVLVAGTALSVIVALTAYLVLLQFDHNIKSVDLSRLRGRPSVTPTPDAQGRTPLNILVLGATSRTDNPDGVPGGDHDNQSDTIMLAHISADRSWASVVSLPRDLMVHIPSCRRGTTLTAEHQHDQINNAFAYGGPACSIATIEGVTGLRIDHFIEIDFQGFKDLTDAVGGVPVCLPAPVNDNKSGLHLPAGPQLIKGDTALAFVRTRYGLEPAGLGDGGDLDRIRLQQQFTAALIRKLDSGNLLLNPVSLYNIIDTLTRSITTDTALASTTELAGLAHTLSDLHSNKITFTTAPTTTYPPDPNRLQLDQPAADQLFTLLRHDQQPTDHPSTPQPTTSPAAFTNTLTTAQIPATTTTAASCP